ncbi:MAG: hypothetical protein ABJA82_09485 [Myxococcales bacterium]
MLWLFLPLCPALAQDEQEDQVNRDGTQGAQQGVWGIVELLRGGKKHRRSVA